MHKNKSELVSKLDAAQRQLETAIQLWFNEQDTVSILTLAASAHQIVHDLNSKVGGDDLLFDTPFVKDEFRRDFIRLMKKPWNFFKHADQDKSSDFIELRESSIAGFILYSIKGLTQLGRPPSGLRAVFLLWIGIQHPERLLSRESFRSEFKIDEATESFLQPLSRSEFLLHSLSIFQTFPINPT